MTLDERIKFTKCELDDMVALKNARLRDAERALEEGDGMRYLALHQLAMNILDTIDHQQERLVALEAERRRVG